MAETKTKRAKPAKKAKASSSAKTSKAKPKAARKSTARKTKARPKSASSTHSNGNGSSHVVGDGAKAVRDAVGSAGKGAGHAVSKAGKEAGHAVGKAKIPLLAGGAAVVGTVGGIALGASRSGDKVLGVKLPKPKRVKLRSKDLSNVAKEVGRFGENVGELTTELKHARQGLANGEGKQNSPIEILLNGLTSRR
jgi:hypothetical protein